MFEQHNLVKAQFKITAAFNSSGNSSIADHHSSLCFFPYFYLKDQSLSLKSVLNKQPKLSINGNGECHNLHDTFVDVKDCNDDDVDDVF